MDNLLTFLTRPSTIIIIILVIVIIVLLGICLSSRQRLNQLIDQNDTMIDKLDAATQLANRLNEENSNYKRTYGSISMLKDSCDVTMNRLNEINDQYDQAIDNLDAVQKQMEEKNKSVGELQTKNTELVNSNDTLTTTIAAKSEELADLEAQLNKLKGLVAEQEALYKKAVLAATRQDLGQGYIGLTEKELELVKLIDVIAENYPVLKDDILSIAWKKVWLPKMQNVAAENELKSGMSGIYKLSLVDRPDIVYIGQATDIKDRWYEHGKKLVGVDKKGSEKLYNYTIIGKDGITRTLYPSDLKWEVAELYNGEGDRGKWLDEHEHYWISFYGCVEVGLNKKK